MVSNLSRAFAEPKACHPSQTMPPGGTVFAVNLPGAFSELRFWVNDDEYETSDQNDTSHFVNLWRIDSSELANGVAILSGTSLLASAIEVPFTELNTGWNYVPLDPPIEVNPGLYQVSVNLFAKPSFSLIQDVVPSASPSVLTLVAGSYNLISSSEFPDRVFYDTDQNNSSLNLPNGYFWLDVIFSQIY